jgi:hypothetical protein
MTWDCRLYFPSEGRRVWNFFALKNPTASAGFEPMNLGTRGHPVCLTDDSDGRYELVAETLVHLNKLMSQSASEHFSELMSKYSYNKSQRDAIFLNFIW